MFLLRNSVVLMLSSLEGWNAEWTYQDLNMGPWGQTQIKRVNALVTVTQDQFLHLFLVLLNYLPLINIPCTLLLLLSFILPLSFSLFSCFHTCSLCSSFVHPFQCYVKKNKWLKHLFLWTIETLFSVIINTALLFGVIHQGASLQNQGKSSKVWQCPVRNVLDKVLR